MSDATYGGLMHSATIDVARAAASPMPTSSLVDVFDLAIAVDAVRRQLCRHIDLVIQHCHRPRHSKPLPSLIAFTDAMQQPWSPATLPDRNGTDPTRPWSRAAAHVGVAADLLATHFGPHGQRLTADARLLDDATHQAEIAIRVAQMACTAADVVLHLARRASLSLDPADPRLPDIVGGWLTDGLRVSATARDVLDSIVVHPTRALDELAAAPPLHPEPVTNLDDAARAMDRLRRLATAQGTGLITADVAALRAYAAAGHTITGHAFVIEQALTVRAGDLHASDAEPIRIRHQMYADSLSAAHTHWGRLHAVLGEVHGPATGPRGWRTDIEGIRTQLNRLTRDNSGFLPPARLVSDLATADHLDQVVRRLTRGLHGFVDDQARIAHQLLHHGQLHVATSTLENADVPCPYARMPADRFDAALDAYAALATATGAMSDAPGTSRCAQRILGRPASPVPIPAALPHEYMGRHSRGIRPSR